MLALAIEPSAIPLLLPIVEPEPIRTRRAQSRWDVSAATPAVEPPDSPDDDDDQPAGRRRNIRANLGDSMLLSAVQDYMGADERNHLSAKMLLFPTDPHYAHHLRWVCGFTDFPLHYLRVTLDRLRPLWDAERKREDKSK
jgi:hypothetical protein